MSGELVAVLIAGGIAVTPTIVQMFVSATERNKVRKHDEFMKRVELYEAPRREQLMKYLDLLGSVCAALSNPNVLFDYSAAYVKASVFVKEDTLKHMEIVDKMILDRYDDDIKDSERIYTKEILYTPEYNELRKYIKNEINPNVI